MFAVIFILVYAIFFKLGVKSGAMSLPLKQECVVVNHCLSMNAR